LGAGALYPSFGGRALEEEAEPYGQALAVAYNEWLSEYCQYAPDRLWGLAVIPLWNVDFAVTELERGRNQGLVGASIWMAPPDNLPFYAPHYERFWAAAEDLRMPVSLHINTGFGPFTLRPPSGTIEAVSFRAHGHAGVGKEALAQIILSGTLERHPGLRIVIAEVNTGWVPFWLQELDENYQRYVDRSTETEPNELAKLPMLPSEYYARQCYSTFIDDTVGVYEMARWWHETAMWSTDYPHWNGIWPKGTEVLNRTLGPLTPEQRYDVVCGNVARLYDKSVPAPLPASDYVPAREEWPARLQREPARNL